MIIRLLHGWSLIGFLFPFVVRPINFAPAPDTVTLHPEIAPISGTELINPMRGYYERRGVETVPLPEITQDAYNRYYWHDPDNPALSLEIAQGVYNFSQIDADINQAASKGNKFAFRIRAMADNSSMKRYIPDYLAGCGWSYRDTFMPDWNGTCFLDNAANLLYALGQRYDGDPRIAWVDIGLYGRSGSWAFSEEIYTSAPLGFHAATDDTLRRIVQMHLDAFPQTRKVMTAKAHSAAVIHALASSYRVGWRADCLGREGYFDFATNPKYTAAWLYMQDRWKTAPVIAEYCSNNVDSTYETALRQVRDFHITAVGNGSIGSWERKTPKQQLNLLQVGKISGYRFQVKEITVPAVWAPGGDIRLKTQWENIGVTPHYETTIVFYRLYDRINRRYVWDAPSAVSLETLLPTTDAPAVIEDSYTLPADIAPGSYELRLIAIDPQAYRQPLKLALVDSRPDGSYRLGNIRVGY